MKEFNLEICSYWRGQASFFKGAFINLLHGRKNSEAVQVARNSIHSSRDDGILKYYSDVTQLNSIISEKNKQIATLKQTIKDLKEREI